MLKKILVASIAAGSIVACSSNKAPAPQVASEPVASAPAPVMEAPAASTPVVMNHNSVYFAFDKYDIKSEFSDLLKANSDYMVSKTDAKVQVQGNTDDIGSVEYNLALGQKRATAAKNALVAGGAAKSQLEAISYGKLKPKYPNDTAANRAQNRRADMVFTAEQPAGYSLDSDGLPMVDGGFFNGTVVTGVE